MEYKKQKPRNKPIIKALFLEIILNPKITSQKEMFD
jgi:hypothetical protein